MNAYELPYSVPDCKSIIEDYDKLDAILQENAHLSTPNIHKDIFIALSLILREAIALGHGGAFAILPDPGSAPLKIASPIAPVDLGEELRDLWASLSVLWSSARGPNTDHLDAVELKRVTAHRWRRRLSSVGHLAAADGCVVLDRRLVLRGFGGSIEKNAEGVLGDCHDLASKTDVPAAILLKSFGERHKSAYALCRRVPQALVFVISQDGDLRLFANDNGRVLFASNLSY
ncbi:hypothetical protein [Gemmata obscuriglobus]|uniref:hypothetical protein n=1 Tax=Gemmata obscuriglobus TaxID=114 RepID=UPI0011CD523D|nr:hypothetical protein [Gemmata obscuriglobus]